VNRVITRDINKVKVGQVIYCCWCDEEGKVSTMGRFRGWRKMFIAGRLLTRACGGSGRTG